MRNTNWGRKGDNFSDRPDLKSELPVYVKSEGVVNVKVKAKDILLKEFSEKVQKGINYINFDLTHVENATPQYQAWLNDNKTDKEAKKIIIKKADDGKFYLQKGKYTIELEKDGVKVEKELTIE